MFWYSYAATSPLELSWTSGVEVGWSLALVGFLGAAALIGLLANAQRKRTQSQPRLRLITAAAELQSAA